ncbi:hypothetical protein [Candidatus Mycobacterium methanotrophicum]|uniref:Uncharacterized protein n=1 Tax=Candidatus Mycobacterium methanotrophicum TaxID=2943498 RepID=A0ABY4QNI4_9MYCO|nr:hypothetical protein [Candidatus Mycobacterium methanotrophicum]UQX12567.1 hypothetical protein M5I08_10275 [Candidatus Mycobacterium methanotrophicum]
MAIDSSDFRVAAGRHVDLATLPTAVKAFYKSHDDYKRQLIVLGTLADLKMAHPTTTPERHRELESFRSRL